MGSSTFTSRLADSASEQLNARAFQYRLAERIAGAEDRAGRHLTRPYLTRHSNALIDFIAITEAFVVERLESAVSQKVAADAKNWVLRKAAYKIHANVDFDQFSGWERFLGYVDARNAIQHNLGRLTAHQLKKYRGDTLRRIALTGIDLNGDLLTVGLPDVRECLELSRRFIDYIERELAP